ncbi:MAG: FtsX-like permease family protein [Nitrososphaerota archaeon]|nr:M28 family peptidase [Candidatus Bathyarchaeota archaeon]MDW8049125.1 FtsX-like permease family protein [Nitrososphaerota archaeon]
MTLLDQHIRFLSSLGSRATGYPGNRIAAQYIYEQFRSLMDNVTVQEFEVVDCIDHGANITFLSTGETIEVYAARPNFVVPSTTPPEGIKGRLMYLEDADLEDLDGKEIEGCIALLDWASASSKWIELYRQGAKAVIFMEPDPLYTFIAPLKDDVFSPQYQLITTFIEDLPLKFPRFIATKEARNRLLGHVGEEVLIKASTFWEKVKTWNIWGEIRGTQWPNQSLLLIAYYDSYSDSPRYAPGAQEACGIASLLEIARYFSLHRPKHTIIFAALSAHHQNLEGSVQFIDDFLDPMRSWYLRKDLGLIVEKNIFWLINIQLDTGSNELLWVPCSSGEKAGAVTTVYWCGNTFDSYTSAETAFYLENFFTNTYAEINMASLGKKRYSVYIFSSSHVLDVEWDVGNQFSWYTKIYDMEPIFLLRNGFSQFPSASAFTTAYYNKFLGRPFDRYEYVNLRNLQDQIEFILYSIVRLDSLDWTSEIGNTAAQNVIRNWLANREANKQTLKNTISAGGTVSRWEVNATGMIGIWNDSIGWFSPVPNALVILEGGAGPQASSNYKTFFNMPLSFRRFTFADENGRYLFKGGIGQRDGRYVGFLISAWVIDAETGEILYAPDMRSRYYASYICAGSGIPELGVLPIFRCSQLVVDVFHPSSLTSPVLPSGESVPIQISLKNEKFEDVLSYGVWSRSNLYVLAVPPGEYIKVMMYATVDRYPFGMILNSTGDNPEGYGYILKPGEQRYIKLHSGISDLIRWTKRISASILDNIPSQENREMFEGLIEAEKMLSEAIRALEHNHSYSKYLVNCIASWNKALRAYLHFRAKAEDAAATVPFFSFIAIPFTIIAEALFLDFRGKRKILSLVLIFSSLIVFLYLFHPGFSIAASPMINVIGFSMLILMFPILIVMFMRFANLLRSSRIKLLGEHEIDISRMRSSFFISFKQGIENMKRRKIRSGLVLIALIILVFSVSSFSSVSAIVGVREEERGRSPPYQGILIRKDMWGYGGFDLGTRIVDFLKAEFGDQAIVAPRAWIYMFPRFRTVEDVDGTYGFECVSVTSGRNVSVNTLWGLTPEEKEITRLNFLVNGSWFGRGQEKAPLCIITEAIAEEGNFSIGDILTIAGTNFTVIGIMSNNIQFLRDLDGEELSPIKFDITPDNPWNVHVDPSYYVIIPYEVLISLGGRVASVSIKPLESVNVPKMAKKIFNLFNVYAVYYTSGDKIYLLSQGLTYRAFGFESQIVPITLVILSLLNMLISAVYERRREISILSSIGLSPSHIGFLFLAETITYAIVGSIIGYLLSLPITSYIAPTGVTLDPTSSHVLLVLMVAMVTVITSTIFPIVSAAKLVTPSMERKWAPSSKPVGDTWEFPLPFTFSNRKEAEQMIDYLKEFSKRHSFRDAPIFNVDEIKEELADDREMVLSLYVNLAPYDLGVKQDAIIRLIRDAEEDTWKAGLTIRRTAGLTEDWERLTLKFVDEIRKQFLLWKSKYGQKSGSNGE